MTMSSRSSALFITPYLPIGSTPGIGGAFRRQQLLVDALARVVGHLTVLGLVRDDQIPTSTAALAQAETSLSDRWGVPLTLHLSAVGGDPTGSGLWDAYIRPIAGAQWTPLFGKFAGPKQQDALARCLDEHPTLVFAHRLHAMMPLLRLRRRVALPPVFMDLDDVEHVAWWRDVGQPPVWPGKRLKYLHVPALVAAEAAALRLARQSFVCSHVDRRRLSWIPGGSKVSVVPNAVNVPTRTAHPEEPTLTILGGYDYLPNRLGADHFIERIWPLVKRQVPAAKLMVAGAHPELIASFGRKPDGVAFLGLVDDLNELYAQTRVSVCPVLSGSGTRVKIMEAAAYAKPIVSTSLGAEGIQLHRDREILIGDTDAEFSEACVKLLCDAGLAVRLGEAARKAIQERYERTAVVRQLADAMTPSRPSSTMASPQP
jgi:glycosyltransferase involved in cell wall biosynthesis